MEILRYKDPNNTIMLRIGSLVCTGFHLYVNPFLILTLNIICNGI